MITIHVLGNLLIEEDRLPLEIIDELKTAFPLINFEELDTAEDVRGDINIIDTVKGIKKVSLIDIDQLETDKIYSLHDFDLAYTLRLMKKTGLLKEVRIFGVPEKISKAEAVSQLKDLIKATLL